MKKESSNTGSKKSAIALALVALIALLSVIVFDGAKKDTTETQTENSTAQELPKAVVSADGKSIGYDGIDTKTALDLLKQYATVETKTFEGLGEYVVSINTIKAEDGKTYWSFYVNNQAAQVGAGQYITKNGEKIEWRLEDVATFAQ